MLKRPLPLRGAVKHYPWGKQGESSLVYRLSGAANPARANPARANPTRDDPTRDDPTRDDPARDDPTRPFAELWFGSHPSAPAMVQVGGNWLPLGELVSKHPAEVLGDAVYTGFGELPFLLKLLSVDRPLSIQAHPSSDQARRLHQAQPEHYPDPRHKPELAVAVSPVELLYDLQPQSELGKTVLRYPEFAQLLGEKLVGRVAQGLITAPELLEQLFRAEPKQVSDSCQALYRRLGSSAGSATSAAGIERWVVRMAELFPQGDIGVLCALLMNYRQLAPGEGIFISPGVLHAYLSGELVECMANSDNVVRGGLTSKYCDVDALLSILKCGEMSSAVACSGTGEYQVDAKEFLFRRFYGEQQLVLSPAGRAQLLFAVDGQGAIQGVSSDGERYELAVVPGSAYLVPAGVTQYQLSGSGLLVFCATVPNSGP